MNWRRAVADEIAKRWPTGIGPDSYLTDEQRRNVSDNLVRIIEGQLPSPVQATFVECDHCRLKPGSPLLCNGCQQNRAAIFQLQKLLKEVLG